MNKLLHRLAMLFLIATFHTQVFATDAPANLITVTTTTGGELGDKILAQVSTLAEVRSLKIIGPINATDYSNTMKGLVRLTYLDMSQAETEAILTISSVLGVITGRTIACRHCCCPPTAR